MTKRRDALFIGDAQIFEFRHDPRIFIEPFALVPQGRYFVQIVCPQPDTATAMRNICSWLMDPAVAFILTRLTSVIAASISCNSRFL